MTDVLMPQLGETVTEGTITRWTKKVGDTIVVDEVLFEVSTDKVDSEVPSPSGGTLSEILVQEGETVDVGTRLATIVSSADQKGTGSTGKEAGGAEAERGAAPASAMPPPAPKMPAAQAIDTIAAPVSQEEAASAPVTASDASGPGFGGLVLSPIVRKLISENNLDATKISGTGAGGRITREDVHQYLQAEVPTSLPAPGVPTPAQTPTRPPAVPTVGVARPAPLPTATSGERDLVVPFSNIRRRTAEHMVASQATSAHTLVTIEVDYDNVDRVRKAVKDGFKAEEGVSLTYLPFITRALVDALREYPYVNASVGNNELIVHRDVNVGIAVDLDFEGLLVPVVRSADGLRLRQIARAIADLAVRARSKKLQADDISGGTLTITNAGGYGTFITYPVINQPQVAILSTDGVKKRPVAIELPDGTDAIAVHPVGMLGLAWDHRAFDGAYASAFLARVKDVLETRDWAAEL